MGLKLNRNKPRNLLLSLIYRLTRMRLLSVKKRLKVYSELEWVFNRLAHEESFRYYQNEHHPIRKGTINFLKEYLESNFKVLDLGTHKGDLAVLILPYVNNIVGIDHDHDLIAKAKHEYQSLSNITFIQQDVNEFFKANDEMFDLLILSHILEHIDNPSSFIDQIKNYFRYIYIEVPDVESNNSNQYRMDTDSSLIYSDADHVSEFDRSELAEILQELNLEIVKSEYRNAVQRYWCKVL